MLEILASGLIVGAAYASLGLAITLVAKMSGVINFSQSAIALLGCYCGLVALSQWNLPPIAGLMISVLVGSFVGCIFGFTIARWFQSADVRVRSSATIALMIGGLTLGSRMFGDIPRSAPNLVGNTHLAFGGVQVGGGLVLALVISICLSIAMDVYIYRTHSGTRLLALAERAVTAELIGIPTQHLTMLVWTIAGAASSLSLFIVMGSTARSSNFMSLSLLIVPGLCAALIGRFQSFYMTLAGGLALGILESWILSIPSIAPYSQAVYLPVVMAVLLWTHRKEVWDGQRA